MLSNPIIRLAIGIPLAALVVYLLFTFMYSMINQDYEQPDVEEQRVLERITPADDNQEVRTRSRNKAQRIDSADKPPPPPKSRWRISRWKPIAIPSSTNSRCDTGPAARRRC